jgi:DNA-binding response OmpR family regulator
MRLHEYKIFLVEDEPLIGMELAMSLEDAGADVEGPIASVEAALLLLKDSSMDSRPNVALLDYRLGTSTSEPIARYLRDMSIPIVFYSGSIKDAQPIADECHCRILTKPSTEAMIVQALLDAMTA